MPFWVNFTHQKCPFSRQHPALFQAVGNTKTITFRTQVKILKIVSMIRKYHKLQTNPWHREEEPHNNHETPVRQTKQSNQLSLPHQDDCKTKMDTKKRTTKHKTITESHNESNNQQRINNRTTALEPTAAKATGGSLNAFYWYQIFALDSVFESNFDNFTPAIIFQT